MSDFHLQPEMSSPGGPPILSCQCVKIFLPNYVTTVNITTVNITTTTNATVTTVTILNVTITTVTITSVTYSPVTITIVAQFYSINLIIKL